MPAPKARVVQSCRVTARGTWPAARSERRPAPTGAACTNA